MRKLPGAAWWLRRNSAALAAMLMTTGIRSRSRIGSSPSPAGSTPRTPGVGSPAIPRPTSSTSRVDHRQTRSGRPGSRAVGLCLDGEVMFARGAVPARLRRLQPLPMTGSLSGTTTATGGSAALRRGRTGSRPGTGTIPRIHSCGMETETETASSANPAGAGRPSTTPGQLGWLPLGWHVCAGLSLNRSSTVGPFSPIRNRCRRRRWSRRQRR